MTIQIIQRLYISPVQAITYRMSFSYIYGTFSISFSISLFSFLASANGNLIRLLNILVINKIIIRIIKYSGYILCI